MMGWEGVFGLLITGLIFLPIQFTDCPFSEAHCVNGHIDDLHLTFQQLSANKSLLALSLGFILVAAAFNGFGSMATKLTSAASRTVIEQTRVIFIWTFFLMYTGVGHETFSWVKLGGFSLIVAGVLFFNQILEFRDGQI